VLQYSDATYVDNGNTDKNKYARNNTTDKDTSTDGSSSSNTTSDKEKNTSGGNNVNDSNGVTFSVDPPKSCLIECRPFD
jgi:hypothetical protein